MVEANLLLILIFLVVLLCLSAFFSGSETALMAISRVRLKHLAETKPVRAKLVERVLKKPERLIGTILLGNNLVNVAMSALATSLAIAFWGEMGIAYVTAVLTLIILIFAEITPKIYAKFFNERVSFLTAPILNVIMILLHPFVIIVTSVSSKILHLIGIDVSKVETPLMTEDEVKTSIRIAWGDGSITTEERLMLSRVFTLNDKTIGQVMIPAEKMITLDADASIDEIFKVILKTGHSRFPLKKGDERNIIGFIHAKDLFRLIDEKRPEALQEIIRLPYFEPASKKIDAQLRTFQARRLHQAVVIDEVRKVVGLITLEDILEELVGSIQDEHD